MPGPQARPEIEARADSGEQHGLAVAQQLPLHRLAQRDRHRGGAGVADLANVGELRAVLGKLPIWGVCLGHQALAIALGGQVVRAPEPIHGRQALIQHDGLGLFSGLPQPFLAMRYHSLAVDAASLPADVQVSAWLDDGLIMGLRSAKWACESVQFHPESVGTPEGGQLAQAAVAWLSELGAN